MQCCGRRTLFQDRGIAKKHRPHHELPLDKLPGVRKLAVHQRRLEARAASRARWAKSGLGGVRHRASAARSHQSHQSWPTLLDLPMVLDRGPMRDRHTDQEQRPRSALPCTPDEISWSRSALNAAPSIPQMRAVPGSGLPVACDFRLSADPHAVTHGILLWTSSNRCAHIGHNFWTRGALCITAPAISLPLSPG